MWALLPFASWPEHRLPLIQFLFIGPRVCSTLLSDLASRLGPCPSLSLHVHRVVKRTCTSKLSIMLGTQNRKGRRRRPFRFLGLHLLCRFSAVRAVGVNHSAGHIVLHSPQATVKALGHLMPGAPQSGFQRILRDAKLLRGLAGRVALHLAQHK